MLLPPPGAGGGEPAVGVGRSSTGDEDGATGGDLDLQRGARLKGKPLSFSIRGPEKGPTGSSSLRHDHGRSPPTLRSLRSRLPDRSESEPRLGSGTGGSSGGKLGAFGPTS